MNERDELVTIKEAIQLTQKSESSIRRMIRLGQLKAEKRLYQGRPKIYLSRRELLTAFADISRNDMVTQIGQNSIHLSDLTGSLAGDDRIVDLLERENERLRKELEQVSQYFNRKIEFLEQRIEEKNEENKRLNEEIKALLREARPERKRRGIVGYLVERITR